MNTTENNYNGALQHPLSSGFDAASTAADVISGTGLTGKTASLQVVMRVLASKQQKLLCRQERG
jgi:hypothetical protein